MRIYCIYKANTPDGLPRVAVLTIAAKQIFSLYARYNYIWGVDTKVNKIPKHQWAYSHEGAAEMLFRTARLIKLVDATGLTPLGVSETPTLHKRIIPLAITTDHTSWWATKNGTPLLLCEPNYGRKEIESEILNNDLTAFTISNGIGIYGGGNHGLSVVIGERNNSNELRKLQNEISLLAPFQAGVDERITDISFLEAVQESKTRKVG